MPRKYLPTFSIAVAIAGTLLVAACGQDAPTAPSSGLRPAAERAEAPERAAASATPVTARVVRRRESLEHPVVVRRLVRATGGTISVGKAGLTLYFSPGALTKDTWITVTADAGRYLSYNFEPHGTVFHAPVVAVQDLSGDSDAKVVQSAEQLFGAYLARGAADISVSGIAKVAEVRPTTVAGLSVAGVVHPRSASWTMAHFSGYALAMGRR